jgi:hypothetical protein
MNTKKAWLPWKNNRQAIVGFYNHFDKKIKDLANSIDMRVGGVYKTLGAKDMELSNRLGLIEILLADKIAEHKAKVAKAISDALDKEQELK